MQTTLKSGLSRRALLRASGAFAAVSVTGRAMAAEDLKIGGIASLTGPAAAFGKDWAEGFSAYVKAWNARGGHQGRNISIDIIDDETNQVNAVNAYRRLAGRPEVSIVWVALASQTALGIKAVASEFKVPVLSGGGVDQLGRPADPWFFKIAQGGSDYVKAALDFGQRRGYKSIGSLHATDAIGQAEMSWIKQFAPAAGIQVVAQETFALTDTNFASQLVKIKNAAPDYIYNGATGNPAILAFRQLKQLEIDKPLLLSQAAISGAFFAGVGGADKVEGCYSVISMGALPAEIGGDTARLFEDLAKGLGRTPILFHTFGWDTGIITEWAAKNSDGSRQGLRDALDKAKGVPGINGPLTFSPEITLVRTCAA